MHNITAFSFKLLQTLSKEHAKCGMLIFYFESICYSQDYAPLIPIRSSGCKKNTHHWVVPAQMAINGNKEMVCSEIEDYETGRVC
jgi:hypothetical protein